MRTQFLISITLILSVGTGAANAHAIAPEGTASQIPAIRASVNWLEFGFIPSGGRFNPHERTLSPRNAHRLHKRWSQSIGCSGSICGGSSAAVANGVAYVGSGDGNVYAFGL